MITNINKKMLSGKKGNAYLWLIIFIVIFTGLTAFIFDSANLKLKEKKVKNAVNNSVKASSLAVLEGEELARGNFLIDPVKGEENFITILANNLNLDKDTLEPIRKNIIYEKPNIVEFEIINNTESDYYSPTLNRTIEIQNPTTVAILEFKVKGMFRKKTLKIYKLSSSQLKSNL
ncbi:hypothetical protein [Senegalia massiliensis]|uniref:Uncharacterized protein n=1 Tax=Senegalia massiliensis TaxID=1720316 RepID=A0A845R2C7_9CLOT|nr:hypothetical protein [Senegalia massiliensis]NBI07582.1 hypothetical protein [Senegalia massiliensis]